MIVFNVAQFCNVCLTRILELKSLLLQPLKPPSIPQACRATNADAHVANAFSPLIDTVFSALVKRLCIFSQATLRHTLMSYGVQVWQLSRHAEEDSSHHRLGEARLCNYGYVQ